ncbi:hypothetical protein SH668x_002883 [Planctomicrobium sp. SH668]|uniref:hypothetical protein n=1 Tax=Planctomicrobium sp. SH668 TaxID=3448126 RepID=UPI003F5AE8AD
MITELVASNLFTSISGWGIFLTALGAIGGSIWAYLVSVRSVPMFNRLVMLAGFVMLTISPVSTLIASENPITQVGPVPVSVIALIGLGLVVLATAGQESIRRFQLRERLRRKIWDRVADQHSRIAA